MVCVISDNEGFDKKITCFFMHVERFLKYIKHEKRYSQHTIDAYMGDINSFVHFQKLSNPEFSLIENINHHSVRSWIVYLNEQSLSKRTINRKIIGVKRFYKYLLLEGVISANPFDKVIAPKMTKKLPSFVKEKEINNIEYIEQSQDDFSSQRDRLIFEILYCTGIRRSELINIEEKDIDIKAQTIKVTGKRNKQRFIPFPSSLIEPINNYLEKKREKAFTSSYLILTDKGKKAYPHLVYRTVKKYLTLITTIKQKSPHVLRHTYATHLLNNGADLNAIKELLGHENLSATQVYTHNTFRKLTNIYKQAHPRA